MDRLASDNLLAELKGLASASVPDLMERLLARGVKRKEEGTEVSSMDDVVITLRKSSLPMTLLEPMVNNQMLDKIGVSPIRKEYLRLIGRPSAPGAVVSDLYVNHISCLVGYVWFLEGCGYISVRWLAYSTSGGASKSPDLYFIMLYNNTSIACKHHTNNIP